MIPRDGHVVRNRAVETDETGAQDDQMAKETVPSAVETVGGEESIHSRGVTGRGFQIVLELQTGGALGVIPGRERAHETGATAEMQIVVVGEKVLDAQGALLKKLGTDETVVIGPKAAAEMAELNEIKRPAGADPDPTLPPAGILSPTPPEVQGRDSPDHPPGTWTEATVENIVYSDFVMFEQVEKGVNMLFLHALQP